MSNFFFKIFFQNFFFNFFFSKFFLNNFFLLFKKLFLTALLSTLPRLQRQNVSVCICVIKNMIYILHAVEIGLSPRVMWKAHTSSASSSSAHTAHITLSVKSLISSPYRIIYSYYYIFFGICDILLRYSNVSSMASNCEIY